MCHVGLGAARPVQPVDPSGQGAHTPTKCARIANATTLFPWRVEADQGQQTHNVVALDDQTAVHIGLARTQFRPQRDVTRDPRIGEADRDVGEAGHRRAE